MSYREYIGSRYVPIFGRKGEETIEWDNTGTYEPLTVVTYQGASYTSRQFVPIGIDINNGEYWAQTGNYNAQIEQYRQEVRQMDDRVESLEDKFPVQTVNIADGAVTTAKIVDGAVTTAKIVDGAVTTVKIGNGEVKSINVEDGAIGTAKIANGSITTDKIADYSIGSNKIADGAIITDKIADGAVTSEKLANDDILLLFGDSWTNFVDHPDWSIGVNKVLRCGQILNFGVGGAGFTLTSNNIANQLSRANTELTDEQKNNVKYIVVMGGINDFQPTMPNGFLTAVKSVLESCKATYPNAVIQWHPSSCEPTYGATNGPKWLYIIAAFWYYISKYGCENTGNGEVNRYCFPSNGGAFYFNSEAALNTFFDASKLHLNGKGRDAIVNSVLEGFGKVNVPYYRVYWFTRGTRRVEIQITPTSVKLLGSYDAAGDISFGGQGARILVALAAMQAQNMCDNNTPPHFINVPSTSSGTPTFDYCGIWPHSDFTSCDFGTAGSYDGESIRYIMTC